MRRIPTNQRKAALEEALDWLEYRIEVCRKTEREWAAKYGEGHVGCAIERAARHELELAVREIAHLGGLRRDSREYRQGVASRSAFVIEQQKTPTPATTPGDAGPRGRETGGEGSIPLSFKTTENDNG